VGEKSRDIRVDVEGDRIEYYDTIVYDKEQFEAIKYGYAPHRRDRIAGLDVETYGYEKKRIGVILNPAAQSSTLSVTVLNAVTKDGTVCMEFLAPGITKTFDLMQFSDYERRLEWHGLMNNIPTSIVIRLPFLQSHCHSHIWRKR
jgi:hypothetical protein